MKAGESVNNLYGLLGEKLGHSFSPHIHSLIMQKLDIKGYYHLFEVEKEKLEYAVTGFKNLNIKGVNVTIPYKTEIIQYLDETSEEAQKIGAVNTICFDKDKAIGFNTDYYGFGMMMNKFDIKIKNKNAVILGTGGASNSVAQYLLDSGIDKITFVSRDINKARSKFKDFEVIEYEDIKNLKNHQLIINCTPCGMYPDTQKCAVEKEVINSFDCAVDLVYNPSETLFLKYAKAMGLKAVNGLYMLVGQAVKSQEIWNNVQIGEAIVDEIYDEVLSGVR